MHWASVAEAGRHRSARAAGATRPSLSATLQPEVLVDSFSRIIADPKVMLGKPVVKGTRITVELVLERLAGGASVDDLLRSYPRLDREDVHEALRFAAQAVRMERVLAAS